MDKALFLSAIIGPVYLIFGLSILLYVKQWKKVIAEYGKNHFFLMVNMLIALIIGLILIKIYNVWDWSLNLIITLTGWGALVKGVFYFLAPGSWIKWFLNCRLCQSAGFLYVCGIILVILGALLSYRGYYL
jgi:uncharacterized protein YjeT (DUF2065 family)